MVDRWIPTCAWMTMNRLIKMTFRMGGRTSGMPKNAVRVSSRQLDYCLFRHLPSAEVRERPKNAINCVSS
jgi:hypothetical protein